MEIVKANTSVPANVEEAKAQRIQITTIKQAIIAAQKIGMNIKELTPYAVDVLWAEVALGRFLRGMEKNKGGNPNLQPLNQQERLPTVDELAGSHNKSAMLQKIAKFGDDIIQEYIDLCIENELLPKSADLKNKTNKTVHVSHNSGENEWYTPSYLIESARSVMGSINLDPATSALANETVKAAQIFTVSDNGLEHKWHGNVWLNPPYAQPLISLSSF